MLLNLVNSQISASIRQNFDILNNWVFFETPEVGKIDIFIMPKYENALEIVHSDICFNSLSPGHI